MDNDETVWAEYRRIYSAAARMYWLQKAEVGRGPEWSQERRDSWLELSRILHEHAAPGVERTGPSDPTRHLISQRAYDDRPIPLADAARAWQERLDNSPVIKYPRLDPDPYSTGEDAHNAVRFEPGSCVLLPSSWLSSAALSVAALNWRLAPGRPPVVIGTEAAGLSQTFHDLANQVRDAVPGSAPLPHPATASWISAGTTPHIGSTEPTVLDELCWTAHDAAEHTPTKEQATEAGDHSISTEAIEAAQIVRTLLAGSRGEPWRERETGIDPSRSLLVSADHTFEQWDARLRRRALNCEPLPFVPSQPEVTAPPAEGPRMKAMATDTALVVAELLDEHAARLHPGRSTEMIGFDSYPFTHFIDIFSDHLFAL
ncbi:hypothetical protein [Nocardiopsis kunsanensis]|uniref:Uncharacterized protein n=1 Tax=Nocardiopsis kunsanensis TaxID=141693 RepID=A0A918XGR1_9ACTN|nr:hypothetical protein [Nocardiopsis kunsanensis]GHD31210.1 hypothetical protein GCM10007147_33860 [Nocardiopsis kunsanensis]